MEESKRQKFIRIAENRTNKILEMTRLLGNLSNKAVYDYEEKDIRKIFDVIEREIIIAKNKFKLETNDVDKFKLL
jgi:hypothetical protein